MGCFVPDASVIVLWRIEIIAGTSANAEFFCFFIKRLSVTFLSLDAMSPSRVLTVAARSLHRRRHHCPEPCIWIGGRSCPQPRYTGGRWAILRGSFCAHGPGGSRDWSPCDVPWQFTGDGVWPNGRFPSFASNGWFPVCFHSSIYGLVPNWFQW